VELENRLKATIENLIINESISTFLFGSKSQFDDLCHKTVTDLKEKHPNIKRVYVRAEYPYINEHYENYLLQSYEHTYYPQKILNSGKACYIERNCEMIDNSSFCIIYYNENHTSSNNYKSGTEIACNYAVKKDVKIINIIK